MEKFNKLKKTYDSMNICSVQVIEYTQNDKGKIDFINLEYFDNISGKKETMWIESKYYKKVFLKNTVEIFFSCVGNLLGIKNSNLDKFLIKGNYY